MYFVLQTTFTFLKESYVIILTGISFRISLLKNKKNAALWGGCILSTTKPIKTLYTHKTYLTEIIWYGEELSYIFFDEAKLIPFDRPTC